LAETVKDEVAATAVTPAAPTGGGGRASRGKPRPPVAIPAATATASVAAKPRAAAQKQVRNFTLKRIPFLEMGLQNPLYKKRMSYFNVNVVCEV